MGSIKQRSILSPSQWPSWWKRGGCAMILVLCLLTAIGFAAYKQIQLKSIRPLVEKAVRESFPTFCVDLGSEIVVEPSKTMPPVQVRFWDVTCIPGPFPWVESAMLIDIKTCTVQIPLTASFDWYQVFGGLYIDGQKLPVCP